MAGGSGIDRRATTFGDVLRDAQHDVLVAAAFDEVVGVDPVGRRQKKLLLPLPLPLPSDNATIRQEGAQLGKSLVQPQPARSSYFFPLRCSWFFAALATAPITFFEVASFFRSCSNRCMISFDAKPNGVRGLFTRLSFTW